MLCSLQCNQIGIRQYESSILPSFNTRVIWITFDNLGPDLYNWRGVCHTLIICNWALSTRRRQFSRDKSSALRFRLFHQSGHWFTTGKSVGICISGRCHPSSDIHTASTAESSYFIRNHSDHIRSRPRYHVPCAQSRAK